MTAYYNEIDPRAAAWLRELIAQGHIAPGDVDERSIIDVRLGDLAGYTQCHFFAGIGVWSGALRSVGWSDEREVWTGSCPCQPFSSAGKQEGTSDARHLWPAFFDLIRECRPSVVFGEQVASPLGLGWLDTVSSDLEGAGYAVAAADLCAAGVGAPHIRQRLYFVAHADDAGLQGRLGTELRERAGECAARAGGASRGLANADGWHTRAEGEQPGREQRQLPEDGSTRCVGDADCERRDREQVCVLERQPRQTSSETPRAGSDLRPGPTNGFWRHADWLGCTDGKWRPVEPGTFPLAHGAPARVGRLRGYGNAIVLPLAAEFIQAYDEARIMR